VKTDCDLEPTRRPAPHRLAGYIDRLVVIATAAISALLMLTLGSAEAPVLRAQAPVTGVPPSFEVASVRENKSGERTGPYFRYEGSQFVVVNNNLITIIRTAWGLPPDQVLGGPDWIRSQRERFDILAKAPEGITGDRSLRAD